MRGGVRLAAGDGGLEGRGGVLEAAEDRREAAGRAVRVAAGDGGAAAAGDVELAAGNRCRAARRRAELAAGHRRLEAARVVLKASEDGLGTRDARAAEGRSGTRQVLAAACDARERVLGEVEVAACDRGIGAGDGVRVAGHESAVAGERMAVA